MSESGFSPQQGQLRSEDGSHSPQRQRDASLSRLPSPPVIGRKRSLSSSKDTLHQLAKAQKVSEGAGQPKALDYDDVAKEVILCATAIYRCLVSTSVTILSVCFCYLVYFCYHLSCYLFFLSFIFCCHSYLGTWTIFVIFRR